MKCIVTSPIADLRQKPEELFPRDFSHHPHRESQLLFGERLEAIEFWKEWVFVHALEQERFREKEKWHPYPGWVLKSEIMPVETYPKNNIVICVPCCSLGFSYGTYLWGEPEKERWRISLPNGKIVYCNEQEARPIASDKSKFLKEAALFLGAPYLWGGRASYRIAPVASVDCSGLINLLYRAQGQLIPRDAHDQYLKCTEGKELIFFFPREKPERATHVMLHANENHLIESPETGKTVRKLDLSYLNEKEKTHFLRFSHLQESQSFLFG